MENENKPSFFNLPSMVIIILVLCIFSYIGLNEFVAKPYFLKNVIEVKQEYYRLNSNLNVHETRINYLESQLPKIQMKNADQDQKIKELKSEIHKKYSPN